MDQQAHQSRDHSQATEIPPSPVAKSHLGKALKRKRVRQSRMASWARFSSDILLKDFPDRVERIQYCFDRLLFFCAAHCEREDHRHYAKVLAKQFIDDTGIEGYETPAEMFDEVFPMNDKNQSIVKRVS